MQHPDSDSARRHAVSILLGAMQRNAGLDSVKELFWSVLNYERVNQALPRQGWSATLYNAMAEDPILLAGGGDQGQFHVIYARLADDTLSFTAERQIVSKMLTDHPYALFIFSDRAQRQWHLLNVRYDKKQEKRRLYRRITIGPLERLYTATQRIALLDLAAAPSLLSGSPLAIQQRHDEAFNVERVTKDFFGAYSRVFKAFELDLRQQTADKEWAHDYALQFLNRCMFLYFIQKKHWLNDDTGFLRSFWKHYRALGRPADTFFTDWLSVLFFDAFNKSDTAARCYWQMKIGVCSPLSSRVDGGRVRMVPRARSTR